MHFDFVCVSWCFFVMLFQLAFGANVFGSVVLCVGVSACARIALGLVVASGRGFLSCMVIFRVLCRVPVRRWRWLFDKLFHWVSGALSHGSVRFCMVVGAGVVVGSGRGVSVWVSGLQGNVAGLLGLLLY